MVKSIGVASKADLVALLTPFDRELAPTRIKKLEQYPTPTELAAHLVWISYLKGDVKDKTVADFGCGDGRLAIAALLAGSSRAICIEIDEKMIKHAQNIIGKYYGFIQSRILYVVADARDIYLNNVDTVIMNPPFGVARETRGMDVQFLKSALRNAKSVYSIHKYSEGLLRIVHEIADACKRRISWFEVLNLDIPMMYERHRRKTYKVKALAVALTLGGEA